MHEVAVYSVALEEADIIQSVMQNGLGELPSTAVEAKGELAGRWGELKY